MSEQPLRSASPLPLTINGKPTDPETKDECFRLWVELGRSWAAVHRRTKIPESTLRNWGVVDRWEERRREQAAAFLPGRKVETAINLRMAAHSASVRLAELMLASAEQGIDPDPKTVDALTKTIAAGGYSSVGNRNPLEGLDKLQSASTEIDFDAMSVEELRDYEQQVKRKKRFESPSPAVNGSRGKT